MALGIMRNGTPLDSIYGTKGASTAAATGCKQNGTDINQYLLALADGKALGYNVGLQQNGSDMSAKFGIPTGNTPLPINGNTYSASAQSATASMSASCYFAANSSTWSIGGSSSTGGSVPSASGSMPSGATSIQYSFNTTGSGGTNSTTNQASNITALPSSGGLFAQVSASGTPSTPEGYNYSTVTIYIFNASNTLISTTQVTLRATAIGSS